MPEEFLNKCYKKIKKEWKIAFLSAALIGFLTHMYVFTNIIPNHDGLINIYSPQLKFQSGRFFLSPFSGITSFFALPWINGVFSILYLAIMTVLIVELFEIRKRISIILTAGIIVTFPTVAATFTYMFTADGYMFGNLLAVLAILITKKNKKYGFLIGSLIFYLSVGIYQANLTIVLMIVAIWLMRELLFNTISVKEFFVFFLRYMGMTAIGMLLYTITFKTYEKMSSGAITDYQGLDQVGATPDSLVGPFINMVREFVYFFFHGFLADAPINLFEWLNAALFIIILFAFIGIVIQQKLYSQPIKLLLLLLCGMSLPFLGFILYIVSPGVEYHMLMVMALFSIYLLPVVIYDKLGRVNIGMKLYSWGVTLLIALTIFNFAIIGNIAYFNSALKYEKSYALVNRVLDRMEQTEGYENVTKLAIYGRITMHTKLASEIIPNSIPVMTGAMGEHFLGRPYHYQHMLSNYFGKSYQLANDQELQTIKDSELFEEMEAWPSKESVKIVGDTVIIKLN